jgi:cardiolipin synthase
VAGIIFYYAFGINYRRKRSTGRLAQIYRKTSDQFSQHHTDSTESLLKENKNIVDPYLPVIRFMHTTGEENLTKNQYRLLVNGEEKFPEVLKTLGTARHHIHMEYYAWENDIRGNEIKELLIQKVAEGVKVRVIYDAYASRKIKNNIVRELKAAGAEVHPIIRVKLKQFANRINHRDHRKIIVVDGTTGFVGGINVSDRYDNSIDTGLYWRDTHVRIAGPGVANLQRHFLINWNACQTEQLDVNEELFPKEVNPPEQDIAAMSQVMAGGPIYSMSRIMLTYARLFALARQKLYITNPYFIPNETILDTLKQAAKSGVDVRLLLPLKSDSAIVGAASRFYFQELLQAGVRIFLYKKGFVHAKTVVADGMVSIVGTANMDIRSFDLNFEIMPVIYGKDFAMEVEGAFLNDLDESIEFSFSDWQKTPASRKLLYAIARLISAFL